LMMRVMMMISASSIIINIVDIIVGVAVCVRV
jgi:hypothetical protein